ncbi:Abortive infection protein [Xylanimonas cellulosilytica DSM 15894]|uniref:Abortive infection protein n=1 Tax=Xylanimonas cellulosilytica (strain DSM 15894 / JCM 12276 / CECT 5975 / KCTC 9989 / LMG 20990 / NBRC 107835 / XIL07) TaxID=446471 RepID=D1BSF3_XYLCX|nr:CPBP family intramembrane glutamic endopeptidase [Xylanimonas cellulosilytica]ACZ30645.1 Abortive infection protein [Xylanimonas cellulosilytica DSM 15894]
MNLVKQLVVVVAASLVGNVAVSAVEGSWALSLVVGVLAAALALGAYAWVVRRVERRAPVEVGLTGAGRSLGRGLALGLLMFTTVIAIIAALGGYRVAGWGSVPVALTLLGSHAAVATTEELLFRGLVFRRLEERTGTAVALVASAVLFGAIHLVNPAATLWGAIAITVEAGLMLGAVYAATRTLWLPIGLHLGWNFAAAGIFGTEVSGGGLPQGLLRGVTSGPTALSGGAFGPEASVITVAAGLALTVVFLRLAHRRGRLVPRGGRRGPNAAAVEPATATL